jgi:phage tail sheath protein FI
LVGATPAEAFFVQVDTVNNPQLTIDNGEVNISVGVALQRPAEYIIIKIGQFDGGTTVTVA